MRALPGGLFESNHDIGLREDKRGGGGGGGSFPTCDPSGSSILHLNCKSGREEEEEEEEEGRPL